MIHVDFRCSSALTISFTGPILNPAGHTQATDTRTCLRPSSGADRLQLCRFKCLSLGLNACWRCHAGMMEQSMKWKYHSVKLNTTDTRQYSSDLVFYVSAWWMRPLRDECFLNVRVDPDKSHGVIFSSSWTRRIWWPASTARSVPLFVRQQSSENTFQAHQCCDVQNIIHTVLHIQHKIKKRISPLEKSDVVSTYLSLSASLLYIHLSFCLIKSVRKKTRGWGVWHVAMETERIWKEGCDMWFNKRKNNNIRIVNCCLLIYICYSRRQSKSV